MDTAYALATVLAVAALIALMAQLMYRFGHHGRLGRRGVDWAISLGISIVLSFVNGLLMTAINVGFTAVFPRAFLWSFLLGVLVSTPTAYLVVPRVRTLVARAAAPQSPSNTSAT